MKKVMAVILVIAAFACGWYFISGSKTDNAAQEAPIIIKIGSIDSDAHPTIQAMNKQFKGPVEKLSNGRIKVEIYPNAQLGGDREMSEAVQKGILQMAIPATSPLAGFDKRVQILDIPYLFSSRKTAFEGIDGELGKTINGYLESKGFAVLGYLENGMRHVTNSKRPIYTPEDMKGIKIRTMENPMHMAYFKEVGANPTPMSWGELYTALQQKTVDAQENPYALIVDGKFYEVQKYASETGHVFSFELIIANKKFMDELPKDLKEIIEKCAADACLSQRKVMAEQEAAFKEQCIKAGMKCNSLTPEQKKAFIAASEPVYKQFEGELGKEIMEIARKAQK